MFRRMKRMWWLIVAAITAAMVLTYLLSRRQAEAASTVADPPGLIAFYPRAAARAAKPPPEKALRVLSEWQHPDGDHVAFVSHGKRTSFFAVLTKEKLKKPDQALFLSPRYIVAKDMGAVKEGREPLVRATAGEVMDWTYVYDRNGDGRVDYLCYLMGPMPVMPDSFPADFPADSERLDQPRLDYKLDHTRYVFHHVADEDFDGQVDAIVLYVRDPSRNWVKEFASILAPGGAAPDSAWTFRDAVATPTGTLPRANGGFVRHRIKGFDVLVTASNFTAWTEVLARINAAAEAMKPRFAQAP